MFAIELRPPAQQAEFDHLEAVLTKTLGLDWRGMPGLPDGEELAADCAEALWVAGFRVTRPTAVRGGQTEGDGRG